LVDGFAFEDFALPVFAAGILHPISANRGAESVSKRHGLPLRPSTQQAEAQARSSMGRSKVQRLLTGIGFGLFSFFLLAFACRSQAQDYLVGVRGGSSFEGDAGDFQQMDVYAGRYLPWLWGSTNGLYCKPRWEASAGWLHDEGKEGVVVTTGPVIELRVKKFPVTLEGGVYLSALSRYQFPDRDLGGWYEFTDHVGINWHITKEFTVGWRFQHMSNAGIYGKNPGLNLQMLSAAWSF